MFKREPKVKDYTVPPKKKIDWKHVGKESLEWVVCIIIAYIIYLVIKEGSDKCGYKGNGKKW